MRYLTTYTLKGLFFSVFQWIVKWKFSFCIPTDCAYVCACVCVCVGRGGQSGRKREKERKRERERETSGLSQSVSIFCLLQLILFHVMGPVLRRRNGTEKNILLLLLYDKTKRVHQSASSFSSAPSHSYLAAAHFKETATTA